MNVHPQYYALYQSGFAILGIGESVEALMADAASWLAYPIRLDEEGTPLTPRHVHDFSRLDHPYGEIPGDLYIRRCSVALKEAVEQDGGCCHFFTAEDGELLLCR